MKKKMILLGLIFFISIEASGAGCMNHTGDAEDLTEFCSGLKGFNLLGMFDVSWSNDGFHENEFSLIHQLGFNFVRLPIDYRTYTMPGNWDEFVEDAMEKIDHAVEWGMEYEVHVCINLHRAPGYCVNSTDLPPSQQLNLWTDTVAQEAFVSHWETFADRYRDIPPGQLSFNLVNEPSGVTEEVYVDLMKRAADAIHSITPDRIVFVDGMNYARDLIPDLSEEPNVAQSMHCYDPFGLTHYKAEWVSGSDSWPVPRWPVWPVSVYLYGPWKSEYKSALTIEGDFPEGTEVTVNVRQVSVESNLLIKADNQTILSKHFLCTADTGADFSVVVETEWGYQNISNKDFTAVTAEAAAQLSFENSSGDWMTINSVSLKTDGQLFTLYLGDETWGKKQSGYRMDDHGNLTKSDGGELFLFEQYRNNILVAEEYGIAFMVQEFGVYNKTPHNVTTAFLSDLMAFLNENRIGWSLWNFIGSFGILNSGRSDCEYETFQGYQLDALMLEILQSQNTREIPDKSLGGVTAYPSPSGDYLIICSEAFHGRTELYISDISGQLQKVDFFDAPEGQTFFRIDVSGYAPGIYLVSLISNGNRFTSEFAVAH
jgi:hypothetical protein